MKTYPIVDEYSLPSLVRSRWRSWVSQVPVFRFNRRKYNLNMMKYYFVKTISDLNNVSIIKKDNTYMLLSTPRLKFLDVRNCLAPGLSYDGWCKANGFSTEKLVFLYEWLDDYKRLLHIRPISHQSFHSKLKGNITHNEYDKFMQDFNGKGCVTMMD